MNGNFVIETKGLCKTFISRTKEGRKEVQAVKSVDLAVKKGQIFGFLGPNGAGKSTTVKMLSTLLPPTCGETSIIGYDLIKNPGQIRKKIGYVSQTGGTDSYATGTENLILQAQLYGFDLVAARKKAAEFIERFQMASFADRPASTYSGGQKRRLDVALGMIHQPEVLLLDEPTTGLDPQSRAYMWDEIKKMKAEGVTIFLTTHYMDEADKLCEMLAIIDNGTIVAEGTPADLKNKIGEDAIVFGFSSEETARKAKNLLMEKSQADNVKDEEKFVHLYVKNGEQALPGLLRLLDEENLEAQSVTLSKPSLDDVFLKQTGRSLREDVEKL